MLFFWNVAGMKHGVARDSVLINENLEEIGGVKMSSVNVCHRCDNFLI